MAHVPTASSLGLGSGPGKIVPLQGRLNVQSSPADFGAQQAQMVGGFAQDLGQIGGHLLRAQQAVEERDARVSANKFGLDARLELTKWLKTAKQSAAPGAEGFTDVVMEHLDEYKASHLKEVKPGLYRSLVEDDLDRFQISAFEQASDFQSQAKRAKADTDQKASIGVAGSILLTDPGQYAELLVRQLKDIEASGMPASWKEETARVTTAAFTTSMVQGLIEQEPRGTLALLESTPMPGLEGPDQQQLLDRARVRVNALDAEERRNAAENRAEARLALDETTRNQLALAEGGQDFGTLPPDAAWQAAYPATGWQRAKAAFEDRFSRAKAKGSLSTLSLPEIRQTLLDRRPNPALPDYGQQTADYQVLVQAAQETERLALADPAGFAARRSPAVAAAYQEAGGDPAKLGRAIALSLQVQADAGIPAAMLQPLPKQAAEAVGRNLVAITDPQQQVAQVRAVLDTIPDKAIRKRFAASLEGEGGLPKGFTRAVAALERGDAPAAVRIMTALKSDMKIADKGTRDNVGTVLDNEVARGNRGRVAQLQGAWTGDNRELAQLRDERDLAERLAAYGVSGGAGYDAAARQAANDVWGRDVPVIADANLAAVTLPAGANAERTGIGLATIRRGLPVDVEEVRRLIDPQGKGGVITERGAAALIEDWKDQARWVNDGERFALLVPLPDAHGNVTMRPLPGHRWTLQDVESAVGGATVTIPAGRVEEPTEPTEPTEPPAVVAGAPPDRERVYAAFEKAESGGRNIVADDPERALEDRATGPMQVMPGTARDTAAKMGITELQGLDNKATQAWMLAHEDQARAIGRHYLDEQLDRYGDPALAAAAYHGGPDNVDRWLAEFGDPRTGEVTLAFWLRKVKAAGFPRTAGYVTKITGALA